MGSNKFNLVAYLLTALFPLLSASALAATGTVSAIGSGRDSSEAIANLLKGTVAKHFKDFPAPLARSVLQSEILPNASSFVQSYKVLEGGRSGSVSLSASIDLDVINGLMSLSPKAIGESEGAKALVLMREARIPDSVLTGMKPDQKIVDPFNVLAAGARERMNRRGFSEVTLSAEEMQALGAGEDLTSPELLRGMGAKVGARVVLGISGRFETYENENSHNRDERLVLSATLVDVKAGSVITKASVNVVSPKTRREQYLADLQRNIIEDSKDLFQDIFVAAGKKLVKSDAQVGFAVVRVQFPSNNGLVQKFRALLETLPGIRSVTEYRVTRGKFDLAVRPAPQANFAKQVAGLQSPDISVSLFESLSEDHEPVSHPPILTVKISPKEAVVPGQVEGVIPNGKR